jgi:hypothetical protein
MSLKTLLTISAIYLGVLGVGFMLAPRQLGIDAVPPDASPTLLSYLRVFGGPMVGIGVLNWLPGMRSLLRRGTRLSWLIWSGLLA